MPSCDIVVSTPIARTARVAQVEGIFDLSPLERSEERWRVNLPIEDFDWNVGLIVGPSGSGKTTVARNIFGSAVFTGFDWPEDKSILDGFPGNMSIHEIVELLSSVGLSSPPVWLKPFHVLSTGQQMRVNVARLLAERRDIAVMDEFTSTVDRVVAQIGSSAIAKAVRRRKQKFVAVTCHYDVVEWLQPDWIFQPHSGEFLNRFPGKRPDIQLTVRRVHRSAWNLFSKYHYLSQRFHNAARCFVAFLQPEDVPVALQAMMQNPHPKAVNVVRGHRAVCLPDYQGVGIGSALNTFVASAYKGLGFRVLSTTASPSLVASRSRDPRWKCIKKPSLSTPRKTRHAKIVGWVPALNRLTSTWEYVGPALPYDEAWRLVYG